MALVEKIEAAQQLARALACSDNIATVQQSADDDIVLNAQSRKRAHDLEGAADAAPAYLIRRQAADRLAGKADRARSRRRSC